MLLCNMGPVSRIYDHTIRRLNGKLFGFIGNAIYTVLVYLSKLVSFACDMCQAWVDASCRLYISVLLWQMATTSSHARHSHWLFFL